LYLLNRNSKYINQKNIIKSNSFGFALPITSVMKNMKVEAIGPYYNNNLCHSNFFNFIDLDNESKGMALKQKNNSVVLPDYFKE
jgi:hypothetical protein